MRAIVIKPGSAGAHLAERPQPQIATPDQVLMRVVRVGICGTDREEISGGRADAPRGQAELVIGHEMLGRVEAVGAGVRRVKPGDLAVFTVRRGCGACANCGMQRADMCQTGNYRERGIRGLDGYQTVRVVDSETNVVRVPPELEPEAVLLEPLSIVEKAIDESMQIQRRRNPEAAVTPDWLQGRTCLVAGLGPVGLLAALVLRLRGGTVLGLDVVDATSARPSWLQAIGGQYLDGRNKPRYPSLDVIVDATGVAPVEFSLLDALGWNGIYVLTGIPGGDRPMQVDGAAIIRQLVLRNQVMLGSVNAARGHFQMGADDLMSAGRRWPGLAARLITHRHTPAQFIAAADAHDPTVIKEVVEWGG